MAITTDTAQQQKLKLKRRQKFIALKVGGEIRRKGLCTCLKLYRPNWGHNSEGLREREAKAFAFGKSIIRPTKPKVALHTFAPINQADIYRYIPRYMSVG